MHLISFARRNEDNNFVSRSEILVSELSKYTSATLAAILDLIFTLVTEQLTTDRMHSRQQLDYHKIFELVLATERQTSVICTISLPQVQSLFLL